MSPEIRSDLMVYETADGPIWNGQDEIVVREALPDERARWLFIRANSEPPDTPGGGAPPFTFISSRSLTRLTATRVQNH
jgi:hypothetical protein